MAIQPVSQPISPLRRRMLEDMARRGLRTETQRDYVRFVQSFAAFLRRPPDTATGEDTGHRITLTPNNTGIVAVMTRKNQAAGAISDAT
jgi:hypothetical protein